MKQLSIFWFKDQSEFYICGFFPSFMVYWLECSPTKHGRLVLILSWVIPKTLKMVSAASLALTLCI